jgi:hypothetical protein
VTLFIPLRAGYWLLYSHSFNMGKYLVFLLLLTSCANPKKLHRMMDKLPEAAAKECAERYPIKETIDTVKYEDTELLRAYEDEFRYMSEMIDSLLSANCDTVVIDRIKEVIRKIPDKPQIKYIIKTQENTAKLQVLQNDCDKKVAELTQISTKNATELQIIKGKNDKLQTRNIWLWLIIILLTIFSLRNLFK